MNTEIRTSLSHPIEVSWLPGELPGRVGLTFAPGKRSNSKWGRYRWERDLEQDLVRLVEHHRVDVLVCLLEDHELARYGIPDLLSEARAHGLFVLRLPILDGGVLPDLKPVQKVVKQMTSHLDAGQNVVVHCAGGLGRTGTVAGCWLVSQGMSAIEAIDTLHRVRSRNCPETTEQEKFIAVFAERLGEFKRVMSC